MKTLLNTLLTIVLLITLTNTKAESLYECVDDYTTEYVTVDTLAEDDYVEADHYCYDHDGMYGITIVNGTPDQVDCDDGTSFKIEE